GGEPPRRRPHPARRLRRHPHAHPPDPETRRRRPGDRALPEVKPPRTRTRTWKPFEDEFEFETGDGKPVTLSPSYVTMVPIYQDNTGARHHGKCMVRLGGTEDPRRAGAARRADGEAAGKGAEGDG